jgi:hypothetical protein
MSKRSTGTGGWAEYKRLVLAELDRHQKWLETLNEKVTELESEQKLIKFKIALLGAASGCAGWGIPKIFEFLASGS